MQISITLNLFSVLHCTIYLNLACTWMMNFFCFTQEYLSSKIYRLLGDYWQCGARSAHPLPKSSYLKLYYTIFPICHLRYALTVNILAPDLMDPIQTVKPVDSRTIVAEFNLETGASNYIIRIQNANGFFREDTVSSSPAEIKHLTPYTDYTLSIMAANSGGRSQPSLPVAAKTGTVVCHITCK